MGWEIQPRPAGPWGSAKEWQNFVQVRSVPPQPPTAVATPPRVLPFSSVLSRPHPSADVLNRLLVAGAGAGAGAGLDVPGTKKSAYENH